MIKTTSDIPPSTNKSTIGEIRIGVLFQVFEINSAEASGQYIPLFNLQFLENDSPLGRYLK